MKAELGKFLNLSMIFFFIVAAAIFAQEKPVKIELGPSLEIGREELLFGSIASVCEDDASHFYALDRLETRVLKFSAEGRLLAKFGQKGQGPGDFQSPGSIVFTSQEELSVLEDLFYVSFFKTDGTFIRRIDLNGKLGLGFIGTERYYGWIWRPEDQQQVMVDARNNVLAAFHAVARDRFSVNLPDETGRAVMFNYSNDAYVPRFLFDHGGPLSVVGISDRYDLALLDETGRETARIKRDLKPRRFSSRERDFLESELQAFAKSKGWPGRVARELGKKIPSYKNMIKGVCVSPQYIFVFRFPGDLAAEGPLYPVDVFTPDGKYMGTGDLSAIPVSVTGKAMYSAKADEAGNVVLVRTEYKIKF